MSKVWLLYMQDRHWTRDMGVFPTEDDAFNHVRSAWQIPDTEMVQEWADANNCDLSIEAVDVPWLTETAKE